MDENAREIREARRVRRPLGRRIALSYAGFLLRSMVALLAAFSLIYWALACSNAASQARQAARKWGREGACLLLEEGDFHETEEALEGRRLFSRLNGAWVLTVSEPVGEGRVWAAHPMQGEKRLFKGLLIALVALEMIRSFILVRRGERISRRALKPITDIGETARRLSASNLSERIQVHGARDELMELSEVFNDMLDRIESAYNAQRRFASDASHELRTPIAVIQGYADMLDRWGKSDPEVRDESIAAIKSEAAGMKELVEQMLFLARHDNEAHQYEKVYFDAAEMAVETLKDTRLIAGDHEVKQGVMQRAIVLGDRSALKQALRVFVDNAIKFTPKGGQITISCRREERQCRITVEDTGIGVAQEELGNIFERFYRSEDARSAEIGGHGLGLSVARIIVRAHGGQIEAQSRKGVGSRFHILLPL